MMQLLMQLGADINGVPGRDGTTLHYGLESGKAETVNFLLANGVIVDDSIPDAGLICRAIRKDLTGFVITLLESGADINGIELVRENRQSPLDMACCRKDQGLVDLLRQRGAQLQASDAAAAISAIEREPIETLRTLLDYGLNPNASAGWRQSVIESACLKADTAAIALLVEHGADLSGKDASNAFRQVCERGNIEMTTFLLKHGVAATDGIVPAATVANNVAMVDLLLEHGADIGTKDGACFESAAGAECQKVMTRLLKEPMAPSERSNYLGVALQRAAWDANLSFVIWLLNTHDAPINHLGQPYGSPLQAALSQKRDENGTRRALIQTLLERGAAINPPTTNRPASEIEPERKPYDPCRPSRMFKRDVSTTYPPPLSLCLTTHFGPGPELDDVAPELLARGADLNGVGGQFHAPLQTAAAAGLPAATLRALLDAGADVHATGGLYGTALHAAARCHEVESVRLLLARGADARAVAGRYGSALACAAKYFRGSSASCVAVMDLLLAAGADVHCAAGKYGGAVQLAARCGNLDALKWLAAHGADIRAKGGCWGNAYKAALKNARTNKACNWHIVSWLEQHYGREGWD